jgi:hypothetical protein
VFAQAEQLVVHLADAYRMMAGTIWLIKTHRLLYDLLFRASAAAMLEVAAHPKRLGAQIGFISILHTWGQNLLVHPHIHCVVPGGGFSSDYGSGFARNMLLLAR